jgi:hypothetical protein
LMMRDMTRMKPATGCISNVDGDTKAVISSMNPQSKTFWNVSKTSCAANVTNDGKRTALAAWTWCMGENDMPGSVSEFTCKDCKTAPATCWSHALNETCDDDECIQERHGAQCMSCLRDFVRLHGELKLRKN